MDTAALADDARYTASVVVDRARAALRRLVDGAGGLWQRAHPASFRAARLRLKGNADAPPPAPLPPLGSTIALDGMTIRVDPRLSEHNIRKLMAGRHTRHERDLLAGTLRDGDRLMELGGGIGTVAIHSARRLGSDAVFSYEANPDLESLIRENYALNGVEPTLTMCMMGSAEGTRTFYQAPRFSRSSAHVAGEDAVAVEVPVRALTAEIARTGANVLVVDIQGGELELLGDADLTAIRLLLVEVHPDILGVGAVNRLRRSLREAGFKPVDQSGNSLLYHRHSIDPAFRRNS